MPYRLAPNVSYCVASGRYFFLDLQQDRYTCLGDSARAAFQRLEADQEPMPGEEAFLAPLVQKGVLVSSEIGDPPRPCSRPRESERSAYGHSADKLSIVDGALAVASLHRMKRSLRRDGLESEVAAIREAKNALIAGNNCAPDLDRLYGIAQSYELAGLAFSLHDNCLVWSLALAKSALKAGIEINVVFGVTPRPFMAHCWVQIDNTVLNDEVERTQQFTPILVL